jgi:SAM-dependent methyltransferase
MTLAFGSDEKSPRVTALLTALGIAPGTLELAIDARDEMLEFLAGFYDGDREQALFHYFRSGASIAASLEQILRWRFGEPAGIGKLLDFASGYGRVSRFLVREIPPQRVWAADVYAGGVRFQEERLGVHGIASTVQPERFSCAERFDAILVTSLFTHLPEERFRQWLRVLLGCLAPGGMLLFSTHSPELLPPGVEMPAEGFCFRETSESRTLDTSDYGSTWVTEEFVSAALEQAAGPGVSLCSIARGLCSFQDLHVVIAEPGVDFSTLHFRGEPQLFLEGVRLSAGGLRLEGWAGDPTGGVKEVEVFLDGDRLAAVPVDAPREDVAEMMKSERYLRSGWLCCCPLPAGVSHSSSVLLLRAVDACGVGHPLWAGTLETALVFSWRNEARRRKLKLMHVEALRDIERAEAAAEIEALRNRIAAMRASRFWKMRNAWFRFKKLVGLVEEIE